MVGLVRHRQTKAPETDRPYLNHRATLRLHTLAARRVRVQRHHPHSIATLRIQIARHLMEQLPSCPFCYRKALVIVYNTVVLALRALLFRSIASAAESFRSARGSIRHVSTTLRQVLTEFSELFMLVEPAC
jgi:hypothetical protein